MDVLNGPSTRYCQERIGRCRPCWSVTAVKAVWYRFVKISSTSVLLDVGVVQQTSMAHNERMPLMPPGTRRKQRWPLTRAFSPIDIRTTWLFSTSASLPKSPPALCYSRLSVSAWYQHTLVPLDVTCAESPRKCNNFLVISFGQLTGDIWKIALP